MLFLGVHPGDCIRAGEIVIWFIRHRKGETRLGFEASPEIKILREKFLPEQERKKNTETRAALSLEVQPVPLAYKAVGMLDALSHEPGLVTDPQAVAHVRQMCVEWLQKRSRSAVESV